MPGVRNSARADIRQGAGDKETRKPAARIPLKNKGVAVFCSK